MLNKNVFKTYLSKLISTYGIKFIDNEDKRFYFESCFEFFSGLEEMDDKLFIAGIKKIINNCKKFYDRPSPRELYEIGMEYYCGLKRIATNDNFYDKVYKNECITKFKKEILNIEIKLIGEK